MYCDHHTIPKYLMDHTSSIRVPFWGYGGPKNGPKINFFVYDARSFKFSEPTFILCRISSVQKFFSYGAVMGLLKGPQKVQFSGKSSLLILAVEHLRSLIVSSLFILGGFRLKIHKGGRVFILLRKLCSFTYKEGTRHILCQMSFVFKEVQNLQPRVGVGGELRISLGG